MQSCNMAWCRAYTPLDGMLFERPPEFVDVGDSDLVLRLKKEPGVQDPKPPPTLISSSPTKPSPLTTSERRSKTSRRYRSDSRLLIKSSPAQVVCQSQCVCTVIRPKIRYLIEDGCKQLLFQYYAYCMYCWPLLEHRLTDGRNASP